MNCICNMQYYVIFISGIFKIAILEIYKFYISVGCGEEKCTNFGVCSYFLISF